MTTQSQTLTRPPPDLAAEADTATQQAANNVVILKAGTLTMDLRRLPATKNQARRLIKILDCLEPDLEELHQALLDQCRELTDQKQKQNPSDRKTLGDYADRCLDTATACHHAMQQHLKT